MNAGFGSWAAHDAYGFTRAFASTSIGLGALTTNWEATQMTDTAVTLDALETLQVHADLAAEIALDDVLPILDGVNDLRKLLFGQILRTNAGINVGFGEDDFRIAGTQAVNITERNINALVRGHFYSDDAGHVLLKLVKG
jgi:hypothetical protein